MQYSRLTSLVCCAALAMCSSAFAQDHKDTPKPPAEAPKKPASEGMKKMEPPAKPAADAAAAAEAAWMAAAEPGDMHKWLAKGAGEWNCTITQMEPGAPPMVSKGKMKSMMILGGRYQHYQFSGEMMGMPFEGAGTLGYNNVSGKFESTWMDSMSTQTMFGTGTMDMAKKTLTTVSEMVDPVTKKTVTQKEVAVWTDDDHSKSEFFHKGPDGKDMKVMEIVFERAGAGAAKPTMTPAKPAATTPPAAEKPKPAGH